MVNSDFAESKFHAAILVCKQRGVNRQTCLCKNFINVHYCLIIIKIVSDSLQRKLSLQLSLLLDHIHRNTNIFWNYQLGITFNPCFRHRPISWPHKPMYT